VRWNKRGLVFQPAGQFGWITTHAQVPTTLVLPDRLRVYFAARPRHDLSLPTFVDVDRDDPARILGLREKPILEEGRPGTFDADGVMPSCVLRVEDRVLLYYSGWSRLAGRAPYNNATGIAVSYDDGATFARCYEGPILDRAPLEPWSATSPCVVRDGSTWHMWYSSGTDWIDVGGKLEHVYVLKHATSNDGMRWQREGEPILSDTPQGESQTRPAVFRRHDRWHMLFSYRGSRDFRTTGETYRIGYAASDDLRVWVRDDDAAGISLSEQGWDSQMICYPDVVVAGERTYLFYNGNAFGEGGFGYAVLES
jgi:hypothetical protein